MTAKIAMLNPQTLGAAVRFHREAAGLSRHALSELSGVGTTSIYDVEHGKGTVKFQTLLFILEALSLEFKLEGPLMGRFWATHSASDIPDAHR